MSTGLPDGLFEPDNLSLGAPMFAPEPDADRAAKVRACLQHYDTLHRDALTTLERCDNGNPTSGKYRLTFGQQQYFLKSRDGADGFDILRHDALCANLLREHGIPTPVVVRPATGDLVLRHAGSAWLVLEYREGRYFVGTTSETKAAAGLFCEIARACQGADVHEGLFPAFHGRSFVSDLPQLLADAARHPAVAAALPETLAPHRDGINAALAGVAERAARIENDLKVMHLDLHPMNMLIRNGRLSAVLDFKFVQEYPAAAGAGFCAYKLIRQSVVHQMQHGSAPSADFMRQRAEIWLDRWHRSFSHPEMGLSELLWGARYRILDLVHTILRRAMVDGDERFLYDLGKQLRSLREAGMVFADPGTPPSGNL